MGKKNTLRRVLVLIFALALFAVVPGASATNGSGLATNGGFEEPVLTKSWDTFNSVPGWTIEWADTDHCPGVPLLELGKWGTLYDGQFAQLDTHCWAPGSGWLSTDVRISQDVPTIESCQYNLDFAWRQMRTTDRMEVTAPGFVHEYGNTGGPYTWTPTLVPFIADGSSAMISFEETGGSVHPWPDRWGMNLDAVSVMGASKQVFDLIADGGDHDSTELGHDWVDVGYVEVWNDDDTLYVQYFVDVPEWRFTGIHVDVASSSGGIEQNKKGNPIPGKFETKDAFPYPGVSETDVYEFDLDGLEGTPVVAAHASLIDISGLVDVLDPADNWAMNVLKSDQGPRWDGTNVRTDRSDPTDALGKPDAKESEGAFINFFSLGFGGWIVVDFGAPIYNGAPNDLTGVEVTNGAGYPDESAKVEFLYDDVWHLGIGELTNTGTSALQRPTFVQMPAGIPYADAVRITDTTDRADFTTRPTADGYDLDAVKVSQLGSIREETGWGAGDRFVKKGNWAMYIGYTTQICIPD